MNKPLPWYDVLSLYSPSASKLSSKSFICPRLRLGQMFTFRTISQPRACITQYNIPRKWFIHKILPYIYIISYHIISYYILSYHIISYTTTLHYITYFFQSDKRNTRTPESFQSPPATLHPILATLFSGRSWRSPVHGFWEEHARLFLLPNLDLILTSKYILSISSFLPMV